MNKFTITVRRTCKLFSKTIPSGLGEILEIHSAVFNDVDSRPSQHQTKTFLTDTCRCLKVLSLVLETEETRSTCIYLHVRKCIY